MVVDDTAGHSQVTTRGHGQLERLDALFERGAHTAAHLVFFKVLLRGIHVVVTRIVRRKACGAVRGSDGGDLGRAERGVILELQSRVLLVFAHSVGHYAASGRYTVVLHRRSRRLLLAHHRRLLVGGVVVSVVWLDLVRRSESQWPCLQHALHAICLLQFIQIFFRVAVL